VLLPFFGPPIALSGVPRVRFLCPPEVSVLRLGARPAGR
jgi:hypothetical protein